MDTEVLTKIYLEPWLWSNSNSDYIDVRGMINKYMPIIDDGIEEKIGFRKGELKELCQIVTLLV